MGTVLTELRKLVHSWGWRGRAGQDRAAVHCTMCHPPHSPSLGLITSGPQASDRLPQLQRLSPRELEEFAEKVVHLTEAS